jgi:hypothetical protein
MDVPEKVAALILVAPAINFVTYYYDMFYDIVDQEVSLKLVFFLLNNLNILEKRPIGLWKNGDSEEKLWQHIFEERI